MRILIVDDEIDCVNDVVTALSPSGFDLTPCSNPLTAFEMYKENPFDVVISDIRMPGLNGIQLLKKLRELDPEAKVILITGYGDLKTAIEAINNKAWGFFGKPIDYIELVKNLHQIEKEIKDGHSSKIDLKKIKEENERLNEVYKKLLSELHKS